jgi:hypothetical protein
MISARRIDVRMLSPAFNNDPDWIHLVPEAEVQHSKTNNLIIKCLHDRIDRLLFYSIKLIPN